MLKKGCGSGSKKQLIIFFWKPPGGIDDSHHYPHSHVVLTKQILLVSLVNTNYQESRNKQAEKGREISR
jgi:hypothetical protein